MTPEAVKQSLAEHGLSVRDWARANGFSEMLVYAVLAKKNKATRGESYRIAVALGLKPAPDLNKTPSFIRSALQFRADVMGQMGLNKEDVAMT